MTVKIQLFDLINNSIKELFKEYLRVDVGVWACTVHCPSAYS